MNTRNSSTALELALTLFAFLGPSASTMAAQGRPGNASAATAKVDPEVVEFLLASTIKEFKSMDRGRPSSLRKCRIGSIQESGKAIYFLNGSFQASGETSGKWTPFTTIKTADYEHWLGGAAKSYVRQKNVRWFSGDYSKEILRRLDN